MSAFYYFEIHVISRFSNAYNYVRTWGRYIFGLVSSVVLILTSNFLSLEVGWYSIDR